MKTKKIYIYAKGPCWKRQLDAGKIFNYLSKNNYKIVNKPEDADKILLVTCAFLDGKVEYSLDKVKEFQRYDAELIVAGCLPVVEKEKLSKIFDGKIIYTKELDNDIERLFPPKDNIRFKGMDDANILFENLEKSKLIESIKKILRKLRWVENIFVKIEDHILKHLLGEHSVDYKFSKKQFHIRISWGCTGNCSYCTIKKSTGPFHSKPFEECMREFRKGLNKDYKNFVLDATDVGAYGIDINSSFSKLLDEMTRISGNYYLTIREIHPKWITRYIDELEEILKRNKILILDIAIQSSNNRILKLMNRPSDVKKIKDAFLRLKKYSRDVSLTCEFIVGFPTETEEEFKQSLDFIKEINFSGGQIYQFSCRTNTEAEKIEPKIPEEEMVKRMKYTKKFLEKTGYNVTYMPPQRILVFSKRS